MNELIFEIMDFDINWIKINKNYGPYIKNLKYYNSYVLLFITLLDKGSILDDYRIKSTK